MVFQTIISETNYGLSNLSIMKMKEMKRAQSIYPFYVHLVPTSSAGFEKHGIIPQLKRDYMETYTGPFLKLQLEIDKEFDTNKEENTNALTCALLTPFLGSSNAFQEI